MRNNDMNKVEKKQEEIHFKIDEVQNSFRSYISKEQQSKVRKN